MPQSSLVLPTSGVLSGLSTVQAVNAALDATATLNSGAAAPTTTGLAGTAGILWHDTTNNLLKIRNQADTAWITMGIFDEAEGLFIAANAGDVTGKMRNLLIVNDGTNPNTVLNITADELIVKNAGGQTIKIIGVSVSANSALSGAGGLDTGTLALGQTYYVYVVYDPATNVAAGIISTNPSAPTLPSGDTFYARVGWNRTDGSKLFSRIRQVNQRGQYVLTPGTNTATLPAILTGATGGFPATWNNFALSSLIPSTAARINVMVYAPSGSATAIAPNGNYDTSAAGKSFVVVQNPSVNAFAAVEMLIENGFLYYIGNNAACGAYCLGWEDSL